MENLNEIIEIKQMPIIEEKLRAISEEVDRQVETALSLECNEDTVKEVKKVRTALNNNFKDLESRRKSVKEQILKPYNDFEEIYKEYISEKYKNADSQLKVKIDNVENELKSTRMDEVKSYFDELAKKEGLDFLNYSQTNINITLSASMKSLREQAKTCIDKVVDDLKLINSQEHIEEIMFEYIKVWL